MKRLIPCTHMIVFALLFVISQAVHAASDKPKVLPGIDVLLKGGYNHLLKGKRIGIITNHTAINQHMEQTSDLLKKYTRDAGFSVTTLFAPEHGISGSMHANKLISDDIGKDEIPIFSLHGKTKRPTKEMLDRVDVLIYDIQDIGSRSYTYTTTLFYAMEEAAKHRKHVIVLDRPNPLNGMTVDGPLMKEKWRSDVGYINVPYCHGMTVGELAIFFNEEYKIGCHLDIIPMEGWKRNMNFQQTGLFWIPTSPNIPEPTSTWYYPSTGILGELQIVSIGIGYTLPFKIVGAPWIDAEQFSKKLNEQNFPGVHFYPFHFQPFYGKFSKNECHGILIRITDEETYKPVSAQYLIIGILKSLYPDKFQQALQDASNRKEMICKVNGTEEIYRLISEEKYIVWKLISVDRTERDQFLFRREKYLLYPRS